MANDIEIGQESVSEALASGLEDLIAFNWEEVSAGRDYPALDIDWPMVLMLERLGKLVGISARKKGRLIGYASYFIQGHMRHRLTRWAVNDALYVDADHRKGRLAVNLIRAAEILLKDDGVQFITQGDMMPLDLVTGKPRATLGRLLMWLGYKPFDQVYMKRL